MDQRQPPSWWLVVGPVLIGILQAVQLVTADDSTLRWLSALLLIGCVAQVVIVRLRQSIRRRQQDS